MAQPMDEETMWAAAHQLAAELAQRRIDSSIIKTAAAYTKAHPEADFTDWSLRLVRLGDLFSSSQQTATYRHEFWAACKRLRVKPTSAHEWTLVLSWSARLYPFYQTVPRLAQRVSDVRHLRLPDAPPAYVPKPEALLTPLPSAKPTEVIPGGEEAVSKEAEDLIAKLRKKWSAQS
ncbi:MAG: hypothetical protein H6659_06475 [Ardenticatenaceae bacterium]|nr:hypothetical protein [Ardenticatenaceae bacterium]